MRTPQRQKAKILLVEGEATLRWTLSSVLRLEGFVVCEEDNGESALGRLAVEPFDLVLTALNPPGRNGRAVLAEVLRSHPGLPVIVFSGDADVDSAVAAVKEGAWDFLTAPIAPGHLIAVVSEALSRSAARPIDAGEVSVFVAHSRAMQLVVRLVRALSRNDASVVISGPAGSGRERVAREIHRLSSRQHQPFVVLELGHGGETGGDDSAVAARVRDATRAAEGGVLCLRRLATLPMEAQAAVASALPQRGPAGEPRGGPATARLLVLANDSWARLTGTGLLHPALLALCGPAEITVPPLRERAADLPDLAQLFLEEACRQVGRVPLRLSPRALELLLRHDWPANLRELRALTRNLAAVATGNPVRPYEISPLLPETASEAALTTNDAHESLYIEEVLQHTHGNKLKAAQILGMTRPTLYRKIREYGLDHGLTRIHPRQHPKGDAHEEE